MRFKEYRNTISLNTLHEWYPTLMKGADWRFTGWTGNPSEPYRHWAAYPEGTTGLYKQIWDHVRERILQEDGIELRLERMILNSYNHGDSSWLHQDGTAEDDWTVVLFLNPHWDIKWGGDFVLVENNEIIHATAATPGKFILFKGSIEHAARPVSREAPYPRFGMAFQCKGGSNGLQESSFIKISGVSTPF